MKWVLINRLIELLRYTRDAIYAKKKSGVWREGIHWRKVPDGHLFFNLEAIQRRIEGKD